VEVRVIAATNRDLRAEVAAGRFREDLFYRLDVFPIVVAPLAERRADIVPLAEHFLARVAQRAGRRPPKLRKVDRQRLEAYAWPGNVRELQNAMERSMIVWRGGPLDFDFASPSQGAPSVRGVIADDGDDDSPLLTEQALRELERENLRRALRRTRWKVSGPDGAAELLGLRPTTLASRMRKLGLERPV
jgi:DNA-binding NtrC family response regulator